MTEFPTSLPMLALPLASHTIAHGVYTMDKEMQELGTAAVHLLTMATAYMRAKNE
jgi:hypothetical protein